jgi:hypothetical protein
VGVGSRCLGAQRALGARLADVDKGMRKPKRRTFDDLADEFDAAGLGAKPRKKSTVTDYWATLANHPRIGTKKGASRGRPSRFWRICRLFAAPRVGLEPTTLRLTAGCSTD